MKHKSKFNKIGRDKKKKKPQKKLGAAARRTKPGSEEELKEVIAALEHTCPDGHYVDVISETITFLLQSGKQSMSKLLFDTYNELELAVSQARAARLEKKREAEAKAKAEAAKLQVQLVTLGGTYEDIVGANEFDPTSLLVGGSPGKRRNFYKLCELLDEIARNDPAADPKRRRYISNILQSGRNLLEMINELLQMAKIEAGRLEVAIGPASVKDVVEGLAAIMRPQSLAKRIAVETEIEDDLPGVESDAGKLQQILFNFVSNAIKFSPEDTRVLIAARRTVRADGTRCVTASVTDQGPGIPLDMQDTIFEKFRQVDASHTRAHSGTGLGLAICRELAERLGARVSLHSVPGNGATFSVEVPLEFSGKQLEALMPQ